MTNNKTLSGGGTCCQPIALDMHLHKTILTTVWGERPKPPMNHLTLMVLFTCVSWFYPGPTLSFGKFRHGLFIKRERLKATSTSRLLKSPRPTPQAPELLDAVVSDVVAGLVDVSVVGVDGGSVVITVPCNDEEIRPFMGQWLMYNYPLIRPWSGIGVG